jgi:hypothetical protein
MTVRIMSPQGHLGRVPEEKVEQALAAGGQIMTPEKMRELRQAIFMEHGLFQDRRKPPLSRRKRKSLIRRSAR